ncbi:hypothetical protein IWW55_007026 [Coemansia sp. RSA 2706]|nr:hypothetical protein LPJ63_001173 [Coemansia sp. RSA 2711]KAJ1847736.1 hypothetical protein LPJ70_001385 [Coemansia sp. RSA 2708]KAJ2286253.1 hypothetical protein IWW55_007026 [Coemansia sp. RSA 2706]KAJ2314584.1 hypothetical protein IWW52_004248 [Coemansia sp. RSA 2704]KAJ2362830.1 hypothetical protein H4S01_004597 [Coemansia sp. RSA 2610]KAJ2725528.1 hypothetical protein H4R23_004134 [Coemansia sp. Cherry 401B]
MSPKVYADLTSLAKTKTKLANPPGFNPQSSSTSNASTHQRADDSALRASKAWEIAIAPGKSLPMQAFMAWMSGTSVSIFSILITGMILMTPAKGLLSVQQTFAPIERVKGAKVDLSMQKLVFVAINVAGILFGIYRLSIMGLLPTTTSDWLAFIPAKQHLEHSV